MLIMYFNDVEWLNRFGHLWCYHLGYQNSFIFIFISGLNLTYWIHHPLVMIGLLIVWDLGFWHAIVESDSAEALKLIQHNDRRGCLLAIVWCIKELCRRDWNISCFYVPRSGIRVADALATG
ncbi:hypothetical protein GQ457_11G002120 [Hibiscus cannabinus]